MEYLENQQEYHGGIIKAQYKMENGDLYIVTYNKRISEWKLFLDDKMIIRNPNFDKIHEKIPNNKF